MFDLTNKVAFITGAGQGMGAGIAEAMAHAGAKVIATGRSQNVFETAERIGHGVEARLLDVSDEKMVAETAGDILKKYGHVDILVNNAGIMLPVDARTMESEIREKQYRINVCGCWNCTRAFLPQMMEQSYGRIINLSSVTGPMVADSGMMAYAPTKGAILAFTKALALEGAPYNVTANSILPGMIRSHMTAITANNNSREDPEAFFQRVAKGIPMGRYGTAQEVGFLAAFLASDEAGYITGAEIVIDGGHCLPETIALTGPYPLHSEPRYCYEDD